MGNQKPQIEGQDNTIVKISILKRHWSTKHWRSSTTNPTETRNVPEGA